MLLSQAFLAQQMAHCSCLKFGRYPTYSLSLINLTPTFADSCSKHMFEFATFPVPFRSTDVALVQVIITSHLNDGGGFGDRFSYSSSLAFDSSANINKSDVPKTQSGYAILTLESSI
jgi:hypothetical protein